MIQRIKLESVEDKQLPRWVYAMLKAKEDPNAPQDDSGDVKKRMSDQLKAQDFYKLRQQRMKEMAEQQGSSSRMSGLEWRNRPKNKFTEEELKKVLPMSDPVYIVKKTILVSFVGGLMLAATCFIVFVGMSVCAELKMTSNYHHFLSDLHNAWNMAVADPVAYYHRVMGAFDWSWINNTKKEK